MIDLSQLTRGELYELRLAVQNNIDQFEGAALSSLKLGIPVQGYDLKKGRKSRKITDEKALVAELTKEGIPFGDLYDSKLKGIPALEKLTSNRKDSSVFILDGYIEVTEGKPTLVYTGEEDDKS